MALRVVFPNWGRAGNGHTIESFGHADTPPSRFHYHCRTRRHVASQARPALQPPPLSKNRPAEKPEIAAVAAGQPAWFLQQAEEPFQAVALHPKRRPLQLASQKVNRPSDPNEHRHTQFAIMHRHPFLRLGTAKGDKHDIGFGGPNAPHDLFVRHFQQRPERR